MALSPVDGSLTKYPLLANLKLSTIADKQNFSKDLGNVDYVRNHAVYHLDILSGEEKLIFDAKGSPVGDLVSSEIRDKLYFSVSNIGKGGLTSFTHYVYNYASGEISTLNYPYLVASKMYSVSPDGRFIFFRAESLLSKPNSYFVLDTETKQVSLLKEVQPDQRLVFLGWTQII